MSDSLERNINGLKAILAIVAAFWLSWDWALRLLVILIFADIAFGVLAAGVRKELSSEVSFKGVLKKTAEIFAVLICKAVEIQLAEAVDWPITTIPVDIFGRELSLTLSQAIATYLASHELISVAENWGLIGLPLPPWLKRALPKIRRAFGDDESDPAPSPASKPVEG